MSDTLGFGGLNDQLYKLRDQPPSQIRAGHLNLAPAVWLSCDPKSKTSMSCSPMGTGFRLEWDSADSGNWACLGMKLPPDVMSKGRYIALRMDSDTQGPIAFVPCLRYYFLSDPMRDVCTPNPVFIPSGRRVTSEHIPIEAELMARAKGSQLNLFFQSNAGILPIMRLEILLMS